jgi:ADP-ribosylation factor-like protein 2-binding protein
MEDEFQEIKERIIKGNCHHFDEGDENKIICTQIFNQYTTTLESFIQRVQHFYIKYVSD